MTRIIAFAGVPGAGKDTAAGFLQETYPNVVVYKFAHPLQDIVAVIEGNYQDDLSHRRLFDNHTWKNKPFIDLQPIKQDDTVRQEVFRKIALILTGTNPFAKVMLEETHLTLPIENSTDHVVYNGRELYTIIGLVFGSVFTERYYSPRQVMQLFGTDLCREYINEEIWVSIMEERITNTSDTKLILITDTRFLNESTMLTRLGAKNVYIQNKIAYDKAKEQGILAHASEADQPLLVEIADYQLHNPMGDKSEYFENVDRMYTTFVLEDE